MSERLVGNRVAPISGIKGSDSGGGPAPRHSIIYTAPFSSFHFFGSFSLRLTERSTFAKGSVHGGARVQFSDEDCKWSTEMVQWRWEGGI